MRRCIAIAVTVSNCFFIFLIFTNACRIHPATEACEPQFGPTLTLLYSTSRGTRSKTSPTSKARIGSPKWLTNSELTQRRAAIFCLEQMSANTDHYDTTLRPSNRLERRARTP
jgi:hypothetical protein